MSKVINDIVKMEWNSEDMLFTKNKMFVVAAREYETEKGKITVFFTSTACFLWITDEGLSSQDMWSRNDLFNYLKASLDGSFPEMYDDYVPLTNGNTSIMNDAVLDKFGLLSYKEEITRRQEDIAPYGELHDISQK